jgi:hypothetical protein
VIFTDSLPGPHGVPAFAAFNAQPSSANTLEGLADTGANIGIIREMPGGARNVTAVSANATVQGLSSTRIAPTRIGNVGRLGIRVLEVPDSSTTVFSVYDICNGGTTGVSHVALFTNERCTIFDADSVRGATEHMYDTGLVQAQGKQVNGLYKISINMMPPPGSAGPRSSPMED